MKAESVDYDVISSGYTVQRRPDYRIAKQISVALGDSHRVVNIGAGTGSYEPSEKSIVAVDVSYRMLSQRTDSAPAVQALAEQLPFRSDSFDTALAILTLHHWSNQERGLREALRVAKSRVVLLTWIGFPEGFWLADYIPEVGVVDRQLFPSIEKISEILGPVTTQEVPIPKDCTDGFLCAYWARPEQYLDSSVRSAISTFTRIPEPTKGLTRLADDLKTGQWYDRYRDLLEYQSKDYGYRLVIAERADA